MSQFVHDTPKHILQKQFEIIYAKPVQERARMGFEMLSLFKKLVENRIRRTYPYISPIELKLKVFEEMYKEDFTQEQMQNILQSMKEYEQNKLSKSSQNPL
jgi:ParB-like chromosome segregation protein Spo0J